MSTTPATALADARNINRMVEAEGGMVPKVLVDILAGADALAAQPEATDPMRAILDAAVAGELNARKVDELIAEAALASSVAALRGELRRDTDVLFVAAYDQALADGAADTVIDSLCPQFDAAAKVLTTVREIVDMSLDPQSLLNTATAKQLAAYQKLASAIATVGRLSTVVVQFGMRSITFPQIERPANLETAWIGDVALMCTEGDLRHASSVFRERPGNDPGSSPWMRVAPRLNSIGEVRERVRAFAEGAWPQAQGPNVGDGRVNPYALAT